MKVKEAILALNANVVIACERAGFSSATVKMIEDALDTIEDALKEQEARELTIDEWREWKTNPKRNPVCALWENDMSPMWILDPNDVHEPALLMGKLKLFTGKPTLEQCKKVTWR